MMTLSSKRRRLKSEFRNVWRSVRTPLPEQRWPPGLHTANESDTGAADATLCPHLVAAQDRSTKMMADAKKGLIKLL